MSTLSIVAFVVFIICLIIAVKRGNAEWAGIFFMLAAVSIASLFITL